MLFTLFVYMTDSVWKKCICGRSICPSSPSCGVRGLGDGEKRRPEQRFWLGAMFLVCLLYSDTGKTPIYVALIVCFILGLMTKPMLVTLLRSFY